MTENITAEAPILEPISKADREKDLGFGSVVSERSKQRLINQDGTFNVQREGLRRLTPLNLYHTLLAMRWSVFLLLVLLLYFCSNLFFGSIYSLLGESALVDTSSTPMDNIFTRGFFFSVQTFATIGYGTIHPVGFVPNMLVTIESYYSLIANALVTGVVFARFAKPSARVRFSRVAVVAPYNNSDSDNADNAGDDGGTGLMLRIVNSRSSNLLQVNAQIMFSRLVDVNGELKRRFDQLELERKSVAIFPLTWTIVHPIDENSPLKGMTQEMLKSSNAEILVLLNATDETFASIVHARTSYKPGEIVFGHKFTSIYNKIDEGGLISIDVRKLSEIEKA